LFLADKRSRPAMLDEFGDDRVVLAKAMLKPGRKYRAQLLGFHGLTCAEVKARRRVVRPERFELPTFWFVARRSIQLS
jgi:hypothetical protein